MAARGHHRTGRSSRRRRAAWLALLTTTVALGSACSGDDGAGPDVTTGTTRPAPTTTTTEAPLEAGERIYVYVPEVGDCFDRRTLSEEEGGEEIVLLLDCELPHQFEVFHVEEIDASTVPTTTTSTSSTTIPRTTSTEDPDGDGDGSGSGASTTTDPDDPDLDDPDEQDLESTTTTLDLADVWPGEDGLERFARRRCPAAFDPWAGIPYERSELEVGWIVPDEADWADGDRTLACTVFDPAGTSEAPVRLAGSMAGAGR